MLIIVMAFLIILLSLVVIKLTTMAIKLWMFFAETSVIFSRLAMSLLIATGTSFFNFDLVLFGNKFLDFILRTVIVYCAIWVLSYIPRVSPAIGSLCTFFISLLVSLLTAGFGAMLIEIFVGLFKKVEINITGEWWFYLILGIVAAICVIMNWRHEIREMKNMAKKASVFDKPIFIRIGRVIASAIYGLVLTFIIGICIQEIVSLKTTALVILLIVCTVAAYVADLFLFDRVAPPKKEIAK